MTNPIQLKTPRLRLRQWHTDDFGPFAVLNADPRVMEFFPAPLPRSESDAIAKRCQRLIQERGWGFWAVETQSAPFIGFVGLHIPVPELPCSPCVEIGWRLGFDYWGKGYATEAAKAALDFGFKQLNLDEVVSFTSVHNQRSQAVMERLGMIREPETFMHPQIAVGHWLQKHCLYRLKNPIESG